MSSETYSQDPLFCDDVSFLKKVAGDKTKVETLSYDEIIELEDNALREKLIAKSLGRDLMQGMAWLVIANSDYTLGYAQQVPAPRPPEPIRF